MWQATLGGSGKSYSLDATKAYSSSSSSATTLPGFYSSGAGYPPTPPKDSQSPEEPLTSGALRASAAPEADYLASDSADLMSGDMKPTPESLMGFPSFPYSSRKIQEGRPQFPVSLYCVSIPWFMFHFCLVSSLGLAGPELYGLPGLDPGSAQSPPSPYYPGGQVPGAPGAAPGPGDHFTSSPPGPGYSGSPVFSSKSLPSPRHRNKTRSNAGKRDRERVARVTNSTCCTFHTLVKENEHLQHY